MTYYKVAIVIEDVSLVLYVNELKLCEYMGLNRCVFIDDTDAIDNIREYVSLYLEDCIIYQFLLLDGYSRDIIIDKLNFTENLEETSKNKVFNKKMIDELKRKLQKKN